MMVSQLWGFIKKPVVVALCFAALHTHAQHTIDSLTRVIDKSKDDKTRVDVMLQLSKELEAGDMQKAIENTTRARALSEQINYTKGFAETTARLGLEYYFTGDYVNALLHWGNAKADFEALNDSTRVANILSNMGAVYFNQSQYSRAIDLYLQSLKIAEAVHDTMRIGTVLQNIGAVHNEMGNYDLAIQNFTTALTLFTAIRYDEGIGLATENLGEAIRPQDKKQALVYYERALPYLRSTLYFPGVLRTLGELKTSLYGFKAGFPYLDSAYIVALKSNDVFELTRSLNAIAVAYEQNGNKPQAIAYFEKAKSILMVDDLASFELLISTKALMQLYFEIGNYKKAYENAKLTLIARDSVFTKESKQKIDHMLFGYEIDKKNDSIQLLVKDKAIMTRDRQIQEIEVEKQKHIRDGFIIGFCVVLGFSVLVLIQRNKIKKGKKLSDSLLLNILPEEVADELKQKGEAEAKLFDTVTVLFTDFKGFTAMSEMVSPKELVKDLHDCFTAFDHITQKYGLEKIKTIGDSYMAAGGLPSPNTTHATDAVKAAMEMRDFIAAGKAKKMAANQPYFEIRIGLHTGAVVAGIVGVKKFAYDIWGDTVNTASRMESSSEPGKVNISETTYEYVKQHFACTFRGEIEAKGKGKVKMYFVEPY